MEVTLGDGSICTDSETVLEKRKHSFETLLNFHVQIIILLSLCD